LCVDAANGKGDDERYPFRYESESRSVDAHRAFLLGTLMASFSFSCPTFYRCHRSYGTPRTA